MAVLDITMTKLPGPELEMWQFPDTASLRLPLISRATCSACSRWN